MPQPPLLRSWNDSRLLFRYLSPSFSGHTKHAQTLLSEFLNLRLHQHNLHYSLVQFIIVVLRVADSVPVGLTSIQQATFLPCLNKLILWQLNPHAFPNSVLTLKSFLFPSSSLDPYLMSCRFMRQVHLPTFQMKS